MSLYVPLPLSAWVTSRMAGSSSAPTQKTKEKRAYLSKETPRRSIHTSLDLGSDDRRIQIRPDNECGAQRHWAITCHWETVTANYPSGCNPTCVFISGPSTQDVS